MKVSELKGAALDYWVAKAEGIPAHMEGGKFPKCIREDAQNDPGEELGIFIYDPSTDWSYGGPIIEREKISVDRPCHPHPFDWSAHSDELTTKSAGLYSPQYGPTPLIAAMRAYVASKFGNEVNE